MKKLSNSIIYYFLIWTLNILHYIYFIHISTQGNPCRYELWTQQDLLFIYLFQNKKSQNVWFV